MKKFVQIIFLIFLVVIFWLVLANRKSVREFVQNDIGFNRLCSKPVKYSIGSVDSKFNISESELQAEAVKAEKIWDSSVGKNLLEYDPNATLKINLVYDGRQEMTDETNKLDSKLEQLKSQHDLVISQYSQLKGDLKKRADAYNKSLKEYQDRVKNFNKGVSFWDSQGGAPQDEYDKLKKEEKNLKALFDNLEKERNDLNVLIAKSNNLAAKENNIVNNYNNSVNTYQNKYGGTREFEKGIFNGETINIYEFREINDLELTLIHEFGHALGLDHTQNPQSIMYPTIGEQNIDNPALTTEDLVELKNVCKI
jgi:hypothetical protein